MPKQYKIILKRTPDAPKSLSLPKLGGMTFVPGKPVTTASMALARYAMRRPSRFSVEDTMTPVEEVPQEKKALKLEDLPTETEEEKEESLRDPVEEWFDLTTDGLPKNDRIKQFADDHAIDLGTATVKAEMIETIEAALDVD